MPRGGKRPGAGAPKGNVNALKSGTRSKRVSAIMQALMHDDEARLVLTHLAASGTAKAGHVRELAHAMARFMHDHPVAAEVSRKLDDIAAREYAAYDARDVDRLLAEYEQHTRRDALTGRKLTRSARTTPEQQARTARLRARLQAYRKILKAGEALDAMAAADTAGFTPVMETLPGGPNDPAALIEEVIAATKQALSTPPPEGALKWPPASPAAT
jgi:hypothetical protein